jgi:RNA polymerase sigma-70 factor (ECF subfamily)
MADHPDFDRFYWDNYRRLVVSLQLAAVSTELSEEAEDVAQDAFARTLVRWTTVGQGTNPAGYVYRVAFRLQRRSSLRRQRWLKVSTLMQTRARLRRDAQPSSPGDMWAEAAAVRDAIANLPTGCRRAAALCIYAEMTPMEAAAVLGVSASTLRTQLQRARQALSAATASTASTTADEPPLPSTCPAPR